jgi:hypothetical protein
MNDEDIEWHDEKEYDQVGVKLSIFKIVYWWVNMDIIENHDEDHDLDFCLYDYNNDFSHDIDLMVKGNFDDLNMNLFDWMDVFSCLEVVAEIDNLVKDYYDDLLAIREQCKVAFLDRRAENTDSNVIESNDDNRPAWGERK